ncbi:hypothetical protein RIR_jg30311.t1 [Rhizophagus irregularis DAOM 181602=DAOM 197198]|nr:hypothetical protein RIR_jg30311.t1 [Rhizophagus irregularis DAOM 181602=DAOM 197198]
MESLQKNLFPLMQIQIILLSSSREQEYLNYEKLTPSLFTRDGRQISRLTYVFKDYIQRSTGSILGIIKVKKEDFMKGFAQASLQMNSTLTLGRNSSASSIPAIQFMQF